MTPEPAIRLLNVGLDFDGVFVNSDQLKVDAARHLYGKVIPLEKMKKEILVREGTLTPEQYEELKTFVYDTEYGLRMQLIPDVKYYLSKIIGDGHKVGIKTSRRHCDIVNQFMNEQRIKLPVENTGTNENKREICKGLDFFVDDDMEKLLPLTGLVKNLYLFRWPSNQEDFLTDGIREVGSWMEIYQQIKKISSEKKA